MCGHRIRIITLLGTWAHLRCTVLKEVTAVHAPLVGHRIRQKQHPPDPGPNPGPARREHRPAAVGRGRRGTHGIKLAVAFLHFKIGCRPFSRPFEEAPRGLSTGLTALCLEVQGGGRRGREALRPQGIGAVCGKGLVQGIPGSARCRVVWRDHFAAHTLPHAPTKRTVKRGEH